MLLAAEDGIVNGNLNLADILFLAAFILFVVATIMFALKKSAEMAVACAGLACVALAWLVL
jgi:1,4-dihydroxy-2-naphthoate octaprenyltransferase